MAFKFITFALLIAAANAGLLLSTPYAQPAGLIQQRVYQPTPILQSFAQPALIQQQRVIQPSTPILPQFAQPILTKEAQEYDPNPQYSFSYSVQDDLTGDSKQQQETRSGDVVQGSYSLIDADGYKRTVDYNADPANGFNAIVSREPLKGAVIAAQPVVKSFVAQPVVKSFVAQPVVKSYVTQPVVKSFVTQPVVKSFVTQPLTKTATIAYPQQQFLQTPYLTTYSQ